MLALLCVAPSLGAVFAEYFGEIAAFEQFQRRDLEKHALRNVHPVFLARQGVLGVLKPIVRIFAQDEVEADHRRRFSRFLGHSQGAFDVRPNASRLLQTSLLALIQISAILKAPNGTQKVEGD